MTLQLSNVLLLALIACGEPRVAPAKAPAPITRPRVVAHRGASLEAPENTLAAFRRAWELGVECVELDMHVTRDGQVVVIHDPTTKRTAGVDRRVDEQTLAELRALDAGRGEKIPTLAEALDSIPPGRTLFIELKSAASTIPAITRAIAASDPRPRGGKLALQAFDAATLALLAKALPGVPAFWDVDPPQGNEMEGPEFTPGPGNDRRVLPYPLELVADAKARGFGLALDYRAVTDEFLVAARAAGVEMDVWTINDASELKRWLARDVRWVETDRPELVSVPPS